MFQKLGRNSKTANRTAKRTKLWALGGGYVECMFDFDLEHVKVIWGHSVHFSEIGP